MIKTILLIPIMIMTSLNPDPMPPPTPPVRTIEHIGFEQSIFVVIYVIIIIILARLTSKD
tara:strand:+ start:3949 stop:4128 length:180 start_codon:yes stop_codon:yes gene_type:complete